MTRRNRPLDELYKIYLDKSDLNEEDQWSSTPFFNMIRVAYEWPGPLPSELGICDPEDDLVMMMAFSDSYEKMKFIESEDSKTKK